MHEVPEKAQTAVERIGRKPEWAHDNHGENSRTPKAAMNNLQDELAWRSHRLDNKPEGKRSGAGTQH